MLTRCLAIGFVLRRQEANGVEMCHAKSSEELSHWSVHFALGLPTGTLTSAVGQKAIFLKVYELSANSF